MYFYFQPLSLTLGDIKRFGRMFFFTMEQFETQSHLFAAFTLTVRCQNQGHSFKMELDSHVVII
jgi:hypothetical protein